MTTFAIGQRVRTTCEMAIFNIGAFAAGATGTVTDVSPAVDDDTYDGPGSPIGAGATEQEAIDDLMAEIDAP